MYKVHVGPMSISKDRHAWSHRADLDKCMVLIYARTSGDGCGCSHALWIIGRQAGLGNYNNILVADNPFFVIFKGISEEIIWTEVRIFYVFITLKEPSCLGRNINFLSTCPSAPWILIIVVILFPFLWIRN